MLEGFIAIYRVILCGMNLIIKVWACILYVHFLIHFSHSLILLCFIKVLVCHKLEFFKKMSQFFPHKWPRSLGPGQSSPSLSH